MDNTNITYIEGEFQRVTVGKDDVIVINPPIALTSAQFQIIKEHCENIFPDNKVIILDLGLKMGVAALVKGEGGCISTPFKL